MADKNLHDIKIDDLDNPKKTPLKNILTLLALLFIILVISVAITRLILNTDEEDGVVNETNGSISSAIVEREDEASDSDNSGVATTAGLAAATAAGALLVNRTALTERNVSTATTTSSTESKDSTKDSGSKIKTSLREHTPVKAKEISTPKKHNSIPAKPKHVVKKAPTHHTTTHTSSSKKYVDKVVSSNNKKPSSNHSHLGEKRAGYYIKVGTFKDTSVAINKIKKTGLDYILIKPKNDKTTTRVLIGPFKSNWGAKQHLPSVKNSIAEGAYITRID